MPWRVERAGSPGHYTGGWVASNGDLGGVFPTWDAAMGFVGRQLRREERMAMPEVLERWGMKPRAASDRPIQTAWRTPAPPPPSPPRDPRAIPEATFAMIRTLRKEGMSANAIANRIGISQPTAMKYIKQNGW